jgi:hypothetical protein
MIHRIRSRNRYCPADPAYDVQPRQRTAPGKACGLRSAEALTPSAKVCEPHSAEAAEWQSEKKSQQATKIFIYMLTYVVFGVILTVKATL